MKNYLGYLGLLTAGLVGYVLTNPALAQPVDRAITAPALARQTVPIVRNAQAPAEACVTEDTLYAGASFCTKQMAYQALPPAMQRKVSSITAPDGYIVVLYAGPGRTGATCRYVGWHAGVDTVCDNMATGIELQRDVGRAHAQLLAAQQQQGQNAQVDQDVVNQAGFAPDLPRIQAEARAREAREAAEREVERLAANERARKREVRKASLAASGDCLVLLRQDDDDFLSSWSQRDRSCVYMGGTNSALSDDWNDNIERVWVKNPYLQITLWRDINFSGPSITLYCGDYELIDEPENEISSYALTLLENPVACESGNGWGAKRKKWDQ